METAEKLPPKGRSGTFSASDSAWCGNYEIYSIKAGGSGLTNLTQFSGGSNFDESDPDWSPDGTRIIYTIGGRFRSLIAVMNADGSDQTIIPTSRPPDSEPAWSPDGTKIVFTRLRSGPSGSDYEIYTMNADGSDQTNITRNNTLDFHPDWQPRPASPPPDRCTVSGTRGEDELEGTRGDDVICGLGGDDAIAGRGGDDVLRGGPGGDAIEGGPGADKLFGEKGVDALDAADGVRRNDAMNGGGGIDACHGDRGDAETGC